MKKTIKKYLNETFPELKVDSIHGKYYIRFELGGDLRNGTIERVNQAIKRASEIYNQTIGEGNVIILIEDYQTSIFDRENKNKKYLFSIVNEKQFKRFRGPFGQTYYEDDKYGNRVEKVSEDKLECDLLIGNSYLDKEQTVLIIEGISNLEMGFEPCIPQDLYFFSVEKQIGFRVYDDRGCDIWANDKEQLRPIYHKLNKWILDYDRPEIDKIFK
jgi:hypothetical protein